MVIFQVYRIKKKRAEEEEIEGILSDGLGNLSGRSTPESVDMPSVIEKIIDEENNENSTIYLNNNIRKVSKNSQKPKNEFLDSENSNHSVISDISCISVDDDKFKKKKESNDLMEDGADSDQEVVIGRALALSTPKKKKKK